MHRSESFLAARACAVVVLISLFGSLAKAEGDLDFEAPKATSCWTKDAEGQGLSSKLTMESNSRGTVMDKDSVSPIYVDPIPATPDWTAYDPQANWFGYSVASAGDVNGDGYSDVIVGAPDYDGPAGWNQGRAYIYNGSDSGLMAIPSWMMQGGGAGDNCGKSVVSAGDVNGDSYSDVIVGAHEYNNNGAHVYGRAFVYHGGPDELVRAVIQAFQSRWAHDRVEIVWTLTDVDGSVSFEIYHRRDVSGEYVRIYNPEIIQRGDEFIFQDRSPAPGRTYNYRVVVLENSNPVASFETSLTTPSWRFELLQNYPNPFNPTTTISFTLAEKTHANLSIYNIEGKLVKTLVDEVLDEGLKETTWDGTSAQGNRVSSGIYFCFLKAGKRVLTRKMVMIQ